MISERRLAKIESSLTPTEAVLRWLAEAQQCRSLVDYARSIIDLPESAAPLSRICRDVEAAVRAGCGGSPDRRSMPPFAVPWATPCSCTP